MAATLSLDTITSSGSTITVPTGKTLAITDTSALTVGGTAISVGSSNILRKTGDYTIVEADVSGKSELIIAANASASNRTITLPATTTTGLANCIVTILCDADATSTYAYKAQDVGTTEVWTGYQKGDFVRLIVSNSVWLVVDHKETIYSHRYMAANQTISNGATEKLTGNGSGWTSIRDIGNTWSTANDRLDTPTGMNGYWTVSYNPAASSQNIANSPALYIGGSKISAYDQGGANTSGYMDGQNGVTGKYYATSTQAVEFYISNRQSNGTQVTSGGGVSTTHFVAQFERVY